MDFIYFLFFFCLEVNGKQKSEFNPGGIECAGCHDITFLYIKGAPIFLFFFYPKCPALETSPKRNRFVEKY